MPSFLYHASDFPAHYPHLVGTHELAISWAELNWAAQTVGKAEEDVGLHGIYSLFEAAYRTTIVWANLMESGTGRLVKTPSYNALDPSEKGAVSYYLGLTFAELFAYRRLHVPWLLHFDIYGDEHDAYLEGEAKPDLIGLSEAGDWIVYEAKGRTGGLLNSIMDDAKEQAGKIQLHASRPIPSRSRSGLSPAPWWGVTTIGESTQPYALLVSSSFGVMVCIYKSQIRLQTNAGGREH